MKPVRLSAHAQSYQSKRGFTAGEVENAIRTATWREGERGNLECRMDFAFNDAWNGAWYTTKRVRSIFVDNPDEIVVVTVFTYFF